MKGSGEWFLQLTAKSKKVFRRTTETGGRISDEELNIFWSGTWRLEGQVLVTEMDNRPFIKLMKRLNPGERVALKHRFERRKLVKIDSDKMVFNDGYSLDRVKR